MAVRVIRGGLSHALAQTDANGVFHCAHVGFSHRAELTFWPLAPSGLAEICPQVMKAAAKIGAEARGQRLFSAPFSLRPI